MDMAKKYRKAETHGKAQHTNFPTEFSQRHVV